MAIDDLEERKFDLDAEVRRREIALKESEAKRSTGITLNQATLAGTVLTLIGGIIGAVITALSTQSIESGKSLASLRIEELKVKGDLELDRNRQAATENLERKKFETSLILQAIKTSSRADAIRNLKFFVAAGFVSDPEKKIVGLQDESLPSIGVPSPQSAGRATQSTGAFLTKTKNGGPSFQCTGVAISPKLVVTAKICSGVDGSPIDVATFTTQGQSFDVRPLEIPDRYKLALLTTTPPHLLTTFLNRSRIRAPVVGEPVYFAIQLPGSEVTLRTCHIVSLESNEDFFHDCESGLGSAGAVIIAVSDDALLGIHYGTAPNPNLPLQTYGRASKLPAMLASFGEGASNP